jgi:DNA-binding CsgD family transcriptional regulator
MTVRGRPRHPDVLTPREWIVFHLLREGRTNEQIAERLGITLDGAKYHVSSILSKLGVSSRLEASRWRPMRQGHRGWLLLLAFGKITATAVAAAAILGVGILGYGVLISKSGDEALDQTTASAEEPSDALHEAAGVPQEGAVGAPEHPSATPTETPRPPSGPVASGQAAGVIVIPVPTDALGRELLDEGGTFLTPAASSAPTPTPTPEPPNEGCDHCEAKPTPTPTPQAPPQCQNCNVTPTPSGDAPDSPEGTNNPTPTAPLIHTLSPTPVETEISTPAPTPTETPTPTLTKPGEHETEVPHESETPEPTETPQPTETPDH